MAYITPVQRLYRQISQPSPPPLPSHVTAPVKQITLTREDVTAITRRTRGATPEESRSRLGRVSPHELRTI
jgi:hypothetical protein